MKPSLLTLSPLAFAILGATSGAYAVPFQTYTVTTTSDVVNGGDGVISLREAVAAAAANIQDDGNKDQINFDPAVQGQTITLNSTISIDDNIRITAPSFARVTLQRTGEFSALSIGVTADVILDFLNFDGQLQSQPNEMIAISGTNTQLNHINISDVISSSASAINIGESSESVTITGGVYSNNTGGIAGVIYMSGSALSINNSTFQNNSSNANGGVITTVLGSTSIAGSTFTNNATSGNYYGGVGYLAGGNININESSTVSSNSAGSGGAFYVGDTSSNLTISDSILSGNSANDTTENGRGGAVYLSSGEVVISNAEFNNNGSYYDGGAIYASMFTGSAMAVTDSEFFGNSSDFGNGGAISLNVYNTLSFDFQSNEFESNTSFLEGGAFYIFNSNSDATVNITGTEFINNSSDGANEGHMGGAIGAICDTCGMTLLVEESEFDSNSSGYGGAIGIAGYNDTSDYNLNAFKNSFTNNSATFNGGAIFLDVWYGAGTYGLWTENSTYAQNSALNGGAIYLNTREKMLVNSMQYLTVYDNTASVEGGGIMTYGNTATIPLYLHASVLGNNHAAANPDFSVGSQTLNINDSLVGNANGSNNESTNNWYDYDGGNGFLSDIGNNGIISAINIVGMFEPLADNGGEGLTLYPLDTNYIIDVVDQNKSEDQREIARDPGLNDRGAIEAGIKPVTISIPKADLKLKLDTFYSIDLNNYITDSGLDVDPGSYTFTVTSDLPDGFSHVNGVISGTVTQAVIDSLPFVVKVEIDNGVIVRKVELTLKKPSSGGGGSLGWLFVPLLLLTTRFRKRK